MGKVEPAESQNVRVTEPIDIIDKITRLLGIVNVNNFPSEYPLPASQAADLKTVTVENMPTDYAKNATLSSVLTRIARCQFYDSASATWKDVTDNFPIALNVDNVGLAKDATLSSALSRRVVREGNVAHFSVSLTAAGSATIYTPATGKAARVLGWSFYSDADVIVELRFGTSGNVIAGLPAKGAHAMNLIGLAAPQGAADETIVVYGGGAVNVKGWICVLEV